MSAKFKVGDKVLVRTEFTFPILYGYSSKVYFVEDIVKRETKSGAFVEVNGRLYSATTGKAREGSGSIKSYVAEEDQTARLKLDTEVMVGVQDIAITLRMYAEILSETRTRLHDRGAYRSFNSLHSKLPELQAALSGFTAIINDLKDGD